MKILKMIVLCVPLILASCGSKKILVRDNAPMPATVKPGTNDVARQQLAFVQKVNDRKAYVRNIVADMTFTANMDGRKVTVPGSLHMRRGEVIRLQLFIPLLGSEVGRLEFTPDYVLVVDRMHKQYVKGDYNQLDFLRDNGLNFYSLQALFWNELLIPGAEKVGEGDLGQFQAKLDMPGPDVPITLKNGSMNFTWQADKQSGAIGKTDVTYNSASHGRSELVWKYDNFRALGSKQFPTIQAFTFSTTATKKAKEATVRMVLDDPKTTDGWESKTTVSDRYKKIEASDILSKLLDM
jgi:hypothetical protein